jgi:hypothetical protein
MNCRSARQDRLMKSYQFHELRRKYARNGNGYYYYSTNRDLNTQFQDLPKMIVLLGREKGKVGTLQGFDRQTITLLLDGTDDTIYAKYQSIEYLGKDGQPNFAPVTDMTGREITVDSWVVYSCKSGSYSHALGLGQVTKITPAGGLKVKAYLRDGVRVGKQHSYEENVSNPDRSLLLPCEPNTMTMWLLKDFEDIAEVGFDEEA